MLRGTRIMMGQEAKVYVETVNKLRELLHR